MRFLASAILLTVLTAPALAQPWYARGSFNGWGQGNGVTPDPYPMVVDPENPIHYTSTVGEGVFFDDARYDWKIACCGEDGWATNSPTSDAGVYTNSNGGITFHLWDQTSWDDGWFPNNARRVGYDDPQQFDWEIVGSFNDWSATHDSNFYLTDMGNGLHSGTFAMTQGIYDFKFRGVEANLENAWDIAIGNDFGNSAGNNQIAVTTTGDMWTFELDLPNGRWRAFTEAAPPGTPGDYNQDGLVDAADYTTWRDNLNSTTALPNDGGLGTPIGVGHYTQWKNNFGMGSSATWLVHNTPLGAQPGIPDTELNDLGGGEYDLQLTGLSAGEDYEFKVIRSDLTSSVPGSNMKVRANTEGEIDLKFYELSGESWGDGWSPDAAHRVGYVDSDAFDWELIGDFTAWGTDPLAAMTDEGNGLHTVDYTFATPGSYQFKFRQQGDWNTSIGADFGNSAGNNPITITNPNELWHFELDLPNGRWRAYLDSAGAGSLAAVPEPGSLAIVMLGLLWGAAAGRRRR